MRYTRFDVLIAMTIAMLINCSMLIMAASTFHLSGLTDVDSLESAHKTLEPILGATAGALFAVALLSSGLSSSAVGTLAGQVVMQGFIRRQIPLWVRRVVTMLPAFVVVAAGLDPSRTLVLSQVVLSFGIPFALIPLVWFTSRRDVMGDLVNSRLTVVVASAIATLIVGAESLPALPGLLRLSGRPRSRAVERLERLGRLPAQRPDRGPVVGVVDVPDPVVELELLQRGEGVVARLEQREQLLVGAVSISSGSPRVAEERQRHDQHRGDRDETAQDQRDHARASESRATRRRCSRASGHIAISDPARKTNPASQMRLTSGFTKTLK